MRPELIFCLMSVTPSSIRFCQSAARHRLRQPARSFARMQWPSESDTASAISAGKVMRKRSSMVRFASPVMNVSPDMRAILLGMKPTFNQFSKINWA